MHHDLLAIAVDAALKAGRAIIDIYNSPTTDWQVERKADNSPLTLADRRSHDIIAAALAPTGIPILSEEGAHLPYAERSAWKRLWIVDPLDGTKEFLKRNGEFTVNIALVEHGVPVMGVVYAPVVKVMYGGSSEGAFVGWPTDGDEHLGDFDVLPLNARSRSYEASKRPFTVVASRSHLSPETQAYIDALRAHHPDLEMQSAGSSLKLCLVAEGKADVYPRFAPTMEWDTAAGHAVCRAAGCEVYQVQPQSTVPPTEIVPLAYNKPDLHNPWFIVS